MDPPYFSRSYVASVLGCFISMNIENWLISKHDLQTSLKFQVRPDTGIVEQVEVCE